MERIGYRRGEDPRMLREREWIVTNGLGGYASGTIGGEPTRRFHGFLIAALLPPRGRVLAVSSLGESACGADELDEMRLENGLPAFRYRTVERRILLPHGKNVSIVRYRAREPITLIVRPAFQIRPHEGRVDEAPREYPVAIDGRTCEIDRGSSLPVLLVASHGEWQAVPPRTRTVRYAVEEERGYDCEGPLVYPCELTMQLGAGEEATLVLSTDAWDPKLDAGALCREEEERRRTLATGHSGRVAELSIAADQFVIRKLSSEASEDRTVIAGYHWFTDWGRDTMISLEGLCLCTGRHEVAGRILRTFAHHVRDGLIPNLFPEGESQGLYHTADATLWFFHAVDRYTTVTGDRKLLADLLPILRGIIHAHLEGTKFGIGVDPADGLLRQGAEGYQLTWMDAKMGDWVVTPRRGKAVEINALFYNALRLFDRWAPGEGIARAADRLRESFNARFVASGRDHLLDVVDPDDASLRPNQLLAVSLPNPVLDRKHWEPMLQAVRRELLTPVGLRSLGPREPDYKPGYRGDLRSRDGAYHQGTVWGWFIGPFVDAWHKAFPGDDLRPFLAGFDQHLGDFGLGTIAEIFDADPPHEAKGCIAQAWSVAELLRCSLLE